MGAFLPSPPRFRRPAGALDPQLRLSKRFVAIGGIVGNVRADPWRQRERVIYGLEFALCKHETGAMAAEFIDGPDPIGECHRVPGLFNQRRAAAFEQGLRIAERADRILELEDGTLKPFTRAHA